MQGNRDSEKDKSLDNAPWAVKAAQSLRAEVAVRAEWRESLLNEVAALPKPEAERNGSLLWRPISIRPVYAIAACLAALVAGASGVSIFRAPAAVNGEVLSAAGSHKERVHLQTALRGQKTIHFALVAPGASHVSIVGDFNSWNPQATPMKFDRDGNTWLVDMPLSSGRHVYAFVVDGDLVADPSAARVVDNDFGVQNSVVLVGSP